MAGAKKFGMLAGVFTPSILTILGVIMYMRLGWVVGNAGLIGTILIILVAHVISVSTGLSISSIATDKKVGAGGVYYVLSRSLGLPMGGSIGIALFVATSLSISLYLVGFAESFNSYLGLGMSINDIRLSASLGLLGLTTIALISTSVAMKTQFLILAAIIASLVAIFFGYSEYKPESIELFGSADAVPLATVFAIFFPAVTGFTAGIAMSGDLKNSKKSIPFGTLLSIGVGLIVYIGLAVFLSLMVNPEILKTDNNIMMKIALFAPAVVAGIWGATLSSALGGILGGPRILQAMSVDKITPKLFAKGKGKANEPRNALLLTVVIAEGGIMIGELDIIAAVVSMFYLTAYGFINIAFFLESWASTDFNPSFKVKRWIGLLGGISTFVVMFKLDMISMIASFLIVGLIYLYLSRREVTLGSGDIWQSVWSRLVKTGLKKIDTNHDHIRNWKPNVLLFSGGTSVRPHLIEFCQSFGGRKGMITNFDLVENEEATYLFAKHQQSVTDEVIEKYGIFGRKQEVKNVFTGIGAIASTYGFNGVEPNTVFMGWAKNTKDPIWFAQMNQRLFELDLNVLYLDYDENRKFGNYQRIDIWWDDIRSISELSLHLTRFLSSSEDWRNAEIRINYVNNSTREGLEDQISKKLDDFRIDATIFVHNNYIEKVAFHSLVEINSMAADLLILGIPEFKPGEEKQFVTNTNDILQRLSSTLLIRSSSQLILEDAKDTSLSHSVSNEQVIASTKRNISDDAEFAKLIEGLHKKMADNDKVEIFSFLNSWENALINFVDDCRAIYSENDKSDIQEVVASWFNRMDHFSANDIPYLSKKLGHISNHILGSLANKEKGLPKKEKRRIEFDWLNKEQSDTVKLRTLKQRKRLLKKIGISKEYKIPVRAIFRHRINHDYQLGIVQIQNSIGLATFSVNDAIQKSLGEIITLSINESDDVYAKTNEVFDQLKTEIQKIAGGLSVETSNLQVEVCNQLVEDLNRIDASEIIRKDSNKKRNIKQAKKDIESYNEYWKINQSKFTELLKLGIHLVEIRLQLNGLHLASEHSLQSDYGTPLEELFAFANKEQLKTEDLPDTFDKALSKELMDEILPIEIEKLMNLARSLPTKVEIIDSESLNNFRESQRESVKFITINPSEVGEVLIENLISLRLQNSLRGSISNITNIYQRSKNTMKLILDQKVNKETDAADQKRLIKKEVKDSMQTLSQEFDIEKKRINAELREIFFTTENQLDTQYFLKHAEELKNTTRAIKRRKRISRIFDSWRNSLRKRISELSAIILNNRERFEYEKFLDVKSQFLTKSMKYARFSESITPYKTSQTEIPLLYKESFLMKRRGTIGSLVNREREMNLALSILERSNRSGGILAIVGEPLSGKSFMADAIVKNFKDHTVHRINPTKETNVDAKNLRRRILRSKSAAGSSWHSSPPIYVFEDLELWWERSSNGWKIIDEWLKILNAELSDAKVIISISSKSYELFSRRSNFLSMVAGSVHLSPFSEANMTDVLFQTHSVGSVDLFFENELIDKISLRKRRRVIKYLHKTSKGNIGVAQQLWIAWCKVNAEGTIEFIPSEIKTLDVQSGSMDFTVLEQFCFHHSMDEEKLLRVFGSENQLEVKRSIDNLLRGELLLRSKGGFMYIPETLRFFVHQFFTEK